MRAGTNRLRGAVAIFLVLGLIAPPAAAAPLRVRSDRSDNTFYFMYRSDSGSISESSSSARYARGDAVTFLIYIREARNDAEHGERLRARFAFELNKSRVVRYAGTFRLEVRDGLGGLAYAEDVDRKVVLRPRSGQRKKSFSIPFDLPTGSYAAEAFFSASS